MRVSFYTGLVAAWVAAQVNAVSVRLQSGIRDDMDHWVDNSMSLAAQTDVELDSYLNADLDADLDVEFGRAFRKAGGKAFNFAKTGIQKLFGRRGGNSNRAANAINQSRMMANKSRMAAKLASKKKALLKRKKKRANPFGTKGAKYGKKLFGQAQSKSQKQRQQKKKVKAKKQQKRQASKKKAAHYRKKRNLKTKQRALREYEQRKRQVVAENERRKKARLPTLPMPEKPEEFQVEHRPHMTLKARELHTHHKDNIEDLKKTVKNLRKTVVSDQKEDAKKLKALKQEQQKREKQAMYESPYAIYQEALDPNQAENYRKYLQQYHEYRKQKEDHQGLVNKNLP